MAKKQKEQIAQGLENQNQEVINPLAPQYDSKEWLENNDPFFPKEDTSAKYNAEREPKVQVGMEAIKKLDPNFNGNLILLGLWWENKTARAEIKKMIDNEAAAKGIDPVSYLQNDLREQVMKFNGLQEAVDRLKYAITYFKPRGGVKDTFKILSINGKTYNVNLRILAELKEKYVDYKTDEEQKNALFEEVIAASQPIEVDEL